MPEGSVFQLVTSDGWPSLVGREESDRGEMVDDGRHSRVASWDEGSSKFQTPHGGQSPSRPATSLADLEMRLLLSNVRTSKV